MICINKVVVIVVVVVHDVVVVVIAPIGRPRLRVGEPVAAVLEAVRIMAPMSVEIVVAPEVVVIVPVGNRASTVMRMNVIRVIILPRRLPMLVAARTLVSRVLPVVGLALLPGFVPLLLLSRPGVLL